MRVGVLSGGHRNAEWTTGCSGVKFSPLNELIMLLTQGPRVAPVPGAGAGGASPWNAAFSPSLVHKYINNVNKYVHLHRQYIKHVTHFLQYKHICKYRIFKSRIFNTVNEIQTYKYCIDA